LVAQGESLRAIARRYLAKTDAFTVRDLVRKIKELNGIQGGLIRPNQRLMIPLAVARDPEVKRTAKPADFQAKGIFVNRYSMACKKMNRLVDQLVAHGGNTVVLDGKDMTGRLSFPSEVPLAGETGADGSAVIASPEKFFRHLHKKGVHVCVRMVLFYDPLLAKKKPELLFRSETTGKPWTERGKAVWVDPAHPLVQAYNLDIATEMARFGADEIQFDYIRFPTTGITGKTDPLVRSREVPRHETITAFVAKAKEALAAYDVLLSIDVFGVVAWELQEDVLITGQNINDLAKYCDVISPMIYPSHFYGTFRGIRNPSDKPFLMVSKTCERFAACLGDAPVTLRPWIQAFPYRATHFNAEYVMEQLRALDRSKTRGWLLWSAGNVYKVAWEALHIRHRERKQREAGAFGEPLALRP
jgi:hypothetical protein